MWKSRLDLARPRWVLLQSIVGELHTDAGCVQDDKEPALYPKPSLDYLAFGRLLLAGRQFLNREVWDAGRERKTSHGADGAQRAVGDHANVARFGQGSDLLEVGHLAGHVGAYVLDGTPFQQHLELADGVEPFTRRNGDRDVTGH